MPKQSDKHLQSIANFIYETGILSKTPRSGLWFLGTGEQSVAEHSLRCAFIGYALCYLEPKANKEKVVLMCLLHDLGEGRTSDLNWMHQKYGRLAESRAVDDLAKTIPFGQEVKKMYQEVEAKQTLEAKLAKDADQLEWLATMREEETKGNVKAKEWAQITYKRLKTLQGQALGKMMLRVHPDNWWFDAKDKWWVDRRAKSSNKKSKSKKRI